MATERPNFLIIGAAKSGTTALFQYLAGHPDVFCCEPKEPHYFAFRGQSVQFRGPGDQQGVNRMAVTDSLAYGRLFQKARARAVGEASVTSLYYAQAPARIFEEIPDARVICLLRNPALRAFSAYSFMRTRCLEPEEDFARALFDEPRRIAEGWQHIWHYRRMGFYHEQLERFYAVFPRERIRVYAFEEFRRNPEPILTDCFEFLEVDSSWKPDFTPNPHYSGKPKSKLLARFMERENPLKTMLKPLIPKALRHRLRDRLSRANIQRTSLPDELKAELLTSYREDCARLDELVGRDFSSLWLS